MEVYSTEEQQVEAIKRFWQENGTQIIVGAVLGLGGFASWNYYVDKQLEAQEAASAQFETFVEVAQQQGVSSESLDVELKKLVADHGDSGYQIFANLLAAKQSVTDGKFEQAKLQLNDALSSSEVDSLSELIRYRLARIEIELTNYDAAMTLLNASSSEGFAARIAELKGDVAFAQGDLDKAKTQYQAAADKGGLQGNNLLQMKLDDLATAITATN